MMQKKIDEETPLLILIRNSKDEAFPPLVRKQMIETCMSELNVDAKTMIIDDIESVNYSRDVGYDINYIDTDDETGYLSGTEIRNKIDRGDSDWKNTIPVGAIKVLKNYLSRKGKIIWFFGLPSSGKTAIATAVFEKLLKKGVDTKHLDGDVFRKEVTKDLGFTRADRRKNILKASIRADELAKKGSIVLSSFITPYEDVREEIKKNLESDVHFVYIKTSINTCKKRDRKGLYSKAMKNEIKNFTGISDPFDEPEYSELTIDTEKNTVEESGDKIVKYIVSILKV